MCSVDASIGVDVWYRASSDGCACDLVIVPVVGICACAHANLRACTCLLCPDVFREGGSGSEDLGGWGWRGDEERGWMGGRFNTTRRRTHARRPARTMPPGSGGWLHLTWCRWTPIEAAEGAVAPCLSCLRCGRCSCVRACMHDTHVRACMHMRMLSE